MSVPNLAYVPRQLYDTLLYDLHTDAGHAAYTDAVVTTLHGLDPNFTHLKKSPSQTHIHRHGEDSVLYLLDDGTALAVDFIVGANGPNPHPGWSVGEHIYTHADAHDPEDHGIGTAPPMPPTPAPVLKPRDVFYNEFRQINDFYAAQAGLQRPGGMVIDTASPVRADHEAMGAWGYDLMTGTTVEQAITKIRHSSEWQAKHPGETP